MRSPHRLIVVRRGETAIYQAIQQNLDRWPEGTRVIWDRRERDRRTVLRAVTIERRQSERRIPPESMWYTHGFIVAEAHSPADPVADAGERAARRGHAPPGGGQLVTSKSPSPLTAVWVAARCRRKKRLARRRDTDEDRQLHEQRPASGSARPPPP